MSHADSAVATVRRALAVASKSKLAALAKTPDTNLRGCERDDWSPTLRVLRKLEAAAILLLAEHFKNASDLHRETNTPVSPTSDAAPAPVQEVAS